MVHMTNDSRMVHDLFVGHPTAKHSIQEGRIVVPTDIQSKLRSLNKVMFLLLWTSMIPSHHYLKLSTTKVEGMKLGTTPPR
jgi:hypothetical protein